MGQGYFYIIPAQLAESRNPTKALLFGVISSLANEKGFCWASNKYLGDKLGKLKNSRVSFLISELVKEGWLTVGVDEKSNERILAIHLTRRIA